MAFAAMVKAVFILFIGMIVISMIAPEMRTLNKDVAAQDPTGTANKTLETAESIPDPKGTFKEKTGGVLLWLAENHPIMFMMLVFIVAGILILLGVTVKSVMNF